MARRSDVVVTRKFYDTKSALRHERRVGGVSFRQQRKRRQRKRIALLRRRGTEKK